MSVFESFIKAIKKNNFETVYEILKDESFDPTFNNYEAVLISGKMNNVRMLELITEDYRVDPSKIQW